MTKQTDTVSSSDSISIRNYFKDLRKIELLPGDEQIKLARKAKAGDKKALEKLVESNLRFVVSVAKEYIKSGIPFEDLISEGNMGLIKSVDRFDESKGYKFISYAVWWIRQSILQCIYEHGNSVRLPINRINVINKINKIKEKLSKKLDREPTDEEISALLPGIDKEEIKYYLMDDNYEISIHTKMSEDSEDEMSDYLEGDGLDRIEGGLNKESLQSEVKSTLATLSKRESQIIRMYFGMETGTEMTLREIGEKLHLTNERVRQIKEFALRKLRMYNKSSKLREFLNYKIG